MRSTAGLRRALGAALYLLLAHAPAHAALRSPQVVVNGAGLQSYLDSRGEHINVQSDQLAFQVFPTAQSLNSMMVYQFATGPIDPGLVVGIYDSHLSSPDLVPVFPATSGPGWFAVASFRRDPNRVKIILIDASATLVNSQTQLGMTTSEFGFYVQGPGGTLYSQDVRNPGGIPQELTFAGTGIDAGNLWICFESTPLGESDQDFDDVVLFLEEVDVVPVRTASWGELKARFR
jgi:hypothetical protein